MSLQGCLASRKDCSGRGLPLKMKEILDICRSTHQAALSHSMFVVLPDGEDYNGGIYKYRNEELFLLTDKEKTKYTLELYPELFWKESINLEELIRVGLAWQYLSLKAESYGLGVSQRARAPKKINKLVNSLTGENNVFLYSVAVRERDHNVLVEDTSDPLQKEVKEGIYPLDTPKCYEDRAIYEKRYQGVPLDDVIFNKIEKVGTKRLTFHDLSQLLWACQGENDHTTHGSRNALEKNGYGRVIASGCAGYAVYPIVIVDDTANLPKGLYVYNPVGFSALKRWIRVENRLSYDHFLQKFSVSNSKTEIEKEFGINSSNCIILLCIDRKKPCSGFAHSKIGKALLDTKYWAEVEAGMALAGLQLQANALGLQWRKLIISNPDDPQYRKIFDLNSAELVIDNLASSLMNPAKNERLSLKGSLIPTVLFYV